jgi:ABC-2 type transport system permease protein
MLLKLPAVRIAAKEVLVFFSSPIAFIFLATFLAVNLFIFFWVEAFFARNIADVRPLFEWMPILLIFLVAALTMRLWSEERRMGTLEFVMTLPLSVHHFVLGKFLACFTLIGLALILTLPIPITVSLLGHLDWGPVLGGYVATLCLSMAYISIGLYVSSKTDSQIVSLIGTVLICFVLYLLGSDLLTSFIGQHSSDLLKKLGTGSRFESITRGIIDFRDIFYYISIFGVFITLNLFNLEKFRWAHKGRNPRHTLWRSMIFLTLSNFILGNLWLNSLSQLRVDLTRGDFYSISPTTHHYLEQLQEPLLIRGYFSAKTHPLLAPLVPQMKDLLKEFEIAGKGKVRVEFVDPQQQPEMEEEANSKYSIKPVPFQVADKYQAGLVNAYFDILVTYGDQFEVLNFQDLIEVKQVSDTDLDVKLHNPEYDITKTIKKTMHSYQSSGDLFAAMNKPVQFIGYVSAKQQLPEVLQAFYDSMKTTLQTLEKDSAGKFSVTFEDPNQSQQLAQLLLDKYGFRPMTTSLLSKETFFFYPTLQSGDTVLQIPLPDDLSEATFKRSVESTLKRFSTGFTKNVTLVTPAAANPHGFGAGNDAATAYTFLEEVLKAEYTINKNDLSKGYAPADTDLLMVIAPKQLTEKQVFAIDQYLMQGGTVIMATSPYETTLTNTSLTASKRQTGIEAWLKHNGITFEDGMVLDTHNVPFPVPVQRQVNGFTFQEMRLLNYPYFIDIRDQAINQEVSMVAGLSQITLNWASPLVITQDPNNQRTTTQLLSSSNESWLSKDLNILPDFTADANAKLLPTGQQQSYLLAGVVEGQFDSYFKGKPSPLMTDAAAPEDEEQPAEPTTSKNTLNRVIERSPESARLMVIASNQFINDQTLQLVSSAERTLYRNSLQMMQNAIDWSLEDRNLLSIRSRSQFSTTLPSMEPAQQRFWEYLNYAWVFLGLLLLYGIYRTYLRLSNQGYKALLNARNG